MITPELQTYIQQQVGAGITKDVIKQNLSSKGWNMQDVDDAFFTIENSQSQQAIAPSVSSGGHGWMWAVVIIVVLLLGAAGAYAAYSYGLFASPAAPVTPPPTATLPVATTTESSVPITNTESTSTTSTLATTTCDNYECLIAAAAQCQPISVTISYADMPFPLNPDMSMSGQTQYEIQKSSGVNDCTLVFSSPVTILSISDSGRKAAIAKGTTDAQVTSLLKTMNDSAKSTAELQSTCPSNASAISDYLADTQKGTSNVASNGQTNTYTTTSGQKLVCTVVLPPGQIANTSVTIKTTDCGAKNGFTTAITSTGTACSKDQIDLGTIIGVKVNGGSAQCCAPK